MHICVLHCMDFCPFFVGMGLIFYLTIAISSCVVFFPERLLFSYAKKMTASADDECLCRDQSLVPDSTSCNPGAEESTRMSTSSIHLIHPVHSSPFPCSKTMYLRCGGSCSQLLLECFRDSIWYEVDLPSEIQRRDERYKTLVSRYYKWRLSRSLPRRLRLQCEDDIRT